LGVLACASSLEERKTGAWDVTDSNYYLPRYMSKQPFYNTPTGEPTDNSLGEYDNDYGNDSYGKGFEDGCRTYTGVLGVGTLRLNSPTIDGNRMAEDEWYLRGFQDASAFCTFSLDWETH
jgi:hypothetical protein